MRLRAIALASPSVFEIFHRGLAGDTLRVAEQLPERRPDGIELPVHILAGAGDWVGPVDVDTVRTYARLAPLREQKHGGVLWNRNVKGEHVAWEDLQALRVPLGP